MKQFAPEYNINAEGWFKFPADAEYRKRMFPPEVNQHPAKANVYLVQAIIEYVSEPEDILMDIMAGTGTLMVGALIGRSVICIEISKKFHALQVAALEHLERIAPGISGMISLVNLPCQTYLPIPNLADHIIFSPQYAGILKKKSVTDQWNIDTGYDFVEYSKNPLNLGTMSEFLWMHEMEKVYAQCYQTLKPNGSMTLIVKDHMSAGKRVLLTDKAIKASVQVGFSYNPDEHFKWAAPGMPYTSARRARGELTVDDEDIVVLRKCNE
ncbi:MAG: hypothetical protein KAY32_15415 [Candidatus Eisenbacteria sp.]|nr:hypothetical protein [Candidatus Eisenbacteria bacterium]